jgi:hypothetical protein
MELLMVHYLFSFIFLLTSVSAYALECAEDVEVLNATSSCQTSYYKYAPTCKFGDGLCLSLVLQGLVSKNLFDYRPDIRRVYNTPLKRKVFSRTEEYKRLYRAMISDLREVSSASFCATMNTYWLYDVNFGGFTFLPNTLIPKGRLYRLTNISKVANYDIIRTSESTATDIESWETQASMKLAFFKLSKQTSGYVDVALTHFVWLIPTVSYDYEGEIQISYEEGCRSPSYYLFKVGQ